MTHENKRFLPAEIHQKAFGDELVSALLFGSAAEGRLRSLSDVNLLLLLKSFDKNRADLVRETQAAVERLGKTK